MLFCLSVEQVRAQTVVNGNFSSLTSGWGCNAETNTETVYGGPSATNVVAEVDAEAGLCQTISGFTVGSYYRLSFLCSRRTNCGPTLQTMDVTLSGGAASMSVSRNGTAFALTVESVNFFATSTSHTLTFTSTTAGTCNLLVDNVQISLISALPVELSSFSASCSGSAVELQWTTESESKSDFFTIESSSDYQSWTPIAQVAAQSDSQQRTEYVQQVADRSPGAEYYRLTLTNTDGTTEVLAATIADCRSEEAMVYPNPAESSVTVSAAPEDFSGLFDASGKRLSAVMSQQSGKQFVLDLNGIAPGIYFLRVGAVSYPLRKR